MCNRVRWLHTVSVDPREERSARLLRETLFDLASVRDIATITATELSAATGLARRTIYNHGAGPQELLFGYLAEELTEIREWGIRNFSERASVEAFEEGLERLLDHVQRHRAIYERAVSATTSPAWHHMLTQHFTVSLLVFVETFPPASGIARDEDSKQVIASSLAHGMVGAIEAWLRLPGDPGTELCHRLIMALIPPWFIGQATETPA